MSFLDSLFFNNKTVDVRIQQVTQTFVNGEQGPESWADVEITKGIFWIGSMADRLVSEKLRPEVDGVVLVRPSVSVDPKNRLYISSNYYSVIYADDIAFQGQVKIVAVKKYVS